MSKQKQNTICGLFDAKIRASDKDLPILTQRVLNLYFSWNSMNNPMSYCGLTDSRMRASDTDLPAIDTENEKLK